MTLLKRIWTGEEEDSEVKTAYQYVIDLCERIEETSELAKNELSKVQIRNQKYYNCRTRERKLHVGDSVLLLLPTEQNKLTFPGAVHTKLWVLSEKLIIRLKSTQTK